MAHSQNGTTSDGPPRTSDQGEHLRRGHALGLRGLGGDFRRVPVRLDPHLPRHVQRRRAADRRQRRADRGRSGGSCQRCEAEPRQHRRCGVHRQQEVSDVHVDAGADPLRESGRRPLHGDHLGPRRASQAAAGRHDRHRPHPAGAGSRCSARWPAPGGQGPQRRTGQPDQQRDPRAVAGPGRRAVAIALGDWNIQPNSRPIAIR